MSRKPELLIKDITEAIEQIEEWTQDLSLGDFLSDKRTQYAV